jgi:hypothetical protein
MAVPKKKRYKQVVKSRRSLQVQNSIKKFPFTKTRYTNFFYELKYAYCYGCGIRRAYMFEIICRNCMYLRLFGMFFLGKKVLVIDGKVIHFDNFEFF